MALWHGCSIAYVCQRLPHGLLTLYGRPPRRFLARHASRVTLALVCLSELVTVCARQDAEARERAVSLPHLQQGGQGRRTEREGPRTERGTEREGQRTERGATVLGRGR